jgi:hypothetical protein
LEYRFGYEASSARDMALLVVGVAGNLAYPTAALQSVSLVLPQPRDPLPQ